MGVKEVGDNIRRLMKIRSLTIPRMAAMVEIKPTIVSDLLNGKSEPKSSMILKFAKVLGVPREELLADAPIFTSLRFRTGKNLSKREKAVCDQLKYDTATWLTNYQFLEKQLNVSQKFILGEITTDDPFVAANKVREILHIPPDQPIHDITQVVNKAGIKLQIRPFGFKRIFGFSVDNGDKGPAILINSQQGITVERQIFTIAHEIGNLILHKSSYSSMNCEENDETEDDEADLFANDFLVPTNAFVKYWDESKGLPWLDRVMYLKRQFKVSYLTILKRIQQVTKSLKNRDLFIKFRSEYSNKFHYKFNFNFEPNPFDSFDLIELRFSKIVRCAYEKEIISLGRTGEMLNISMEAVRKLIHK